MSVYENGKIKVPAIAWAFFSTFVIFMGLMISMLIVEIVYYLFTKIINGTFLPKIIDIFLSYTFLKFAIGFVLIFIFILLIGKYRIQISQFFSRFDLVCNRIEPSENINKIVADIEKLTVDEQKQIQIILPAVLRKMKGD